MCHYKMPPTIPPAPRMHIINDELMNKTKKFLMSYNKENKNDKWTLQTFYKFLKEQINNNKIDKQLFYMNKVFSRDEIKEFINNTNVIKEKQQEINNNIDTYIDTYQIFLLNYNIDKKMLSTATKFFFKIDDDGSDFASELNNPKTYTSMATVNTFIRKHFYNNTPHFIQHIQTLINNINVCISDSKREIKIQDIVDIKNMTKGEPHFILLDNAMNNIIKKLLDSMFESCMQIETKGQEILLTRFKIEDEDCTLEAWWYDSMIETATNDQITILKNMKIKKIQTEFKLSTQKYILGRFGKSLPEPPINKIPVFCSTHPYMEGKDHALLIVDDVNQNVTIENVRKNNGTFILRGDVTINVNNTIHRLFTNDVIRIGPEFASIQGTGLQQTQNDAKYKLYIPNPKTIILNGFIECSVNDVKLLMASIVIGNDQVRYNECIYNDQYFKYPNSHGGGSAYITIAGRRRKIHIQKGKQYVNYKSELILVSKLKKLIK